MAAHATFAQRFVLEHKRTSLRRVTLKAGFVLAQQAHAATLERLWKVRSATFDRVSFVHVMAIGTTDFALEHRMMMRQFEFRAHLHMALETSLRRFSWINNCAALAATLDVKTSRSMTRLAANVFRVFSLRL
jgi:hypothetical protein